MTATAVQTVSYLMPFVGTPYVYGGEGDEPGQGLDCSRLMQDAMVFAGWPDFPRTTTTQYFDSGFQQLPSGTPLELGDLIYLQVNADGGEPPQHVGMYVGNGQYIEAPETGEDVKIAPVPATAGEFVYGLLRPAYASAPQKPPTAPTPLPQEVLNMADIAISADGNTVTGIRSDGHLIVATSTGGAAGWNNASLSDLTDRGQATDAAGGPWTFPTT